MRVSPFDCDVEFEIHERNYMIFPRASRIFITHYTLRSSSVLRVLRENRNKSGVMPWAMCILTLDYYNALDFSAKEKGTDDGGKKKREEEKKSECVSDGE